MRNLTIIFCASLVLFSFSQVQATIIHVPGDQPTIMAGIAAATTGDTVLVGPGTYYEHIGFSGILVTSEAGPESTIITRAEYGISLVSFTSGQTQETILEGFTIFDGVNYNLGGGGILCLYGSSPTIRNNILLDNLSDRGGGGYMV